MDDPRLDGDHLDVARHDHYDASVAEMLDNRGAGTAWHDPFARPPAEPRPPERREAPPPGGVYALVSLVDGTRHPLRTGINAMGRYRNNDIVLECDYISRRHCVVVVHATGPCEVFDTASRNGTRVNHHPVGRADLLPDDVLSLCDQCFRVDWIGPNGERFDSAAGTETSCGGTL
jgi:pSer/pThr/pTyr-binding forkhead associated (FHA) protein